ncbi:hypothetical protein B0H10DRAFT_1671379, partial [Mycena sp. CBHHK59/15]
LTDLRFFLDLCRNHFPPYYSIPGIHTAAASYSEEEITPTEVLVLGVHGAALLARESRPTIPRADDTPRIVHATPADGPSHEPSEAAGVANDTHERPDVAILILDDSQVMFSEGRITRLKRCWEDMMGVLDNPRGVHPKMATVLEGAFTKIEQIGGDIGRDKRTRKNPRTWDDNNSNTMYLD